jgi:hypothetical protein
MYACRSDAKCHPAADTPLVRSNADENMARGDAKHSVCEVARVNTGIGQIDPGYCLPTVSVADSLREIPK